MTVLLTLLIVAGQPADTIEQPASYTTSVYQQSFESDRDRNQDGWPDQWTRQAGTGFPLYVHIGIEKGQSFEGNHCLKIQLDGGAGIAYSPRISVQSHATYQLEGRLKTQNLEASRAFFTLTYFDSEGRAVAKETSAGTTGTTPWTAVKLDSLAPPEPSKVTHAVIGLHLQSTSNIGDIKGAAFFDEIRLRQRPWLSVRTSSPNNLFNKSEPIEIRCRFSGIPLSGIPRARHELSPVADSVPRVEIQLLDHDGRQVAGIPQSRRRNPPPARGAKAEGVAKVLLPLGEGGRRPDEGHWKHKNYGFTQRLRAGPPPHRILLPDGRREALLRFSRIQKRESLAGWRYWNPKMLSPGFYRINAVIRMSGQSLARASTSLVVLPDLVKPNRSEFGWSLDEFPNMPHSRFIGLCSAASIRWLKMPLELPDDEPLIRKHLSLVERLAQREITTIGVLPTPATPADHEVTAHGTESNGRYRQSTYGAGVTAMTFRVGRWQIGVDNEQISSSRPGRKLDTRQIKTNLEHGGRKALDVFLASRPDWISLFSRHTDLDQEVGLADFVQRMVNAKVQGYSAIYLWRPFGSHWGIMNEQGAPTERFMVWYVVSSMLSGADYLGDLELSHGSTAHVFVRDEQIIMSIWNSDATRETLDFGMPAKLYDVWGRQISASTSQSDALPQLEVGPLPRFVTISISS